jgi:hypothetical protein
MLLIMEQDKDGNLVQEDYTGMFFYDGTTFIIDRFKDFWMITECNFIVKSRGDTFEEAKEDVIKKWHKFKLKK